jgi:hypothetical protein
VHHGLSSFLPEKINFVHNIQNIACCQKYRGTAKSSSKKPPKEMPEVKRWRNINAAGMETT